MPELEVTHEFEVICSECENTLKAEFAVDYRLRLSPPNFGVLKVEQCEECIKVMLRKELEAR